MRGLIFDPFAGISGDMILGALVDLGLEPEWLRDFVAGVGLGPEVRVHIERADRQGISCGRVRFDLPDEHAHRHLRHVLEIVHAAPASDLTKQRAERAFRLLAEAEAEVHGTTPEKVHFHEVGALDAILDVLCAMAGVEQLGFEVFYTRPVALGSGWIDIAHGRFPVPAPATLKLLDGLPTGGHDLAGECTTPTGAAILAALTEGRTAPTEVVVLQSGFGAGTRDPADRPNCLRLIACEAATAADSLMLVQADMDDLSPEYLPAAQDALLEAGALDAVVVHVGMKKGRPGLRLEALVRQDRLDDVLEALFRSTTTIGARYWPVSRSTLPRTEEALEWRGQMVRRKRVRLPDGSERSKVEYDDVVRAADRVGGTPLEVRRALDSEERT